MTKHWALQDAKARLSELVRAAEKEPQRITVRGEPTAVLISESEYRRLSGEIERPKKSFAEWWKSAPRVPEFELPPRKREKPRKLDL
jgi:prevent-host-death family protein